MTSIFQKPYLRDEAAAFEALEAIVWREGPVCPRCGCMGRIAALNGVKDKKGRERLGLKKCYDCRKQFTVRVGTIFERSHLPLHVWFQAAYLMRSSKKGISSNHLQWTFGVTLQTAWFMSYRLREAMRPAALRLWPALAARLKQMQPPLAARTEPSSGAATATRTRCCLPLM